MSWFETMLRRACALSAFIGVAAILALMALTVVTVIFLAIGIAFPGTYSIGALLLIPAVRGLVRLEATAAGSAGTPAVTEPSRTQKC